MGEHVNWECSVEGPFTDAILLKGEVRGPLPFLETQIQNIGTLYACISPPGNDFIEYKQGKF